jgi:TetR/AcrR family transcriptional repressor of nem operon
MRRTKLETAATRVKIVEAARAEFRRHGIDGSGLTGLMAAAGLTQGGFYKHFQSKAQLVAETTTAAVDDQIAQLRERAEQAGAAGAFRASVGGYLCAEHRDGDAGCPYAALGSELARGDEQMRAVAVDGFERMIDLLSGQLSATEQSSTRDQALLAMCAMMGALTVSRMAKGEPLSDEVLAVVNRQLVERFTG